MSTMPNKGRRRVEVDGQSYSYVLKGGKGRYRGQSGPNIRLVIELGPKAHLSTTFFSKNYDDDAEMGFKGHKVPFTPRDVIEVIKAVLANEGTLPEDFDLPLWSVVDPRFPSRPLRA